ncbi:MAG: hypothetical protein WCI76_03030 [bacterium]
MIYLFAGDDAKNKILAYEKFIKLIPKSTETFFITRNDFNPVQIESLYSGSGLFFKESATIFSGALENEETRTFVLDKLEFMTSSTNSFIFLESKLNKPVLDAFKKAKAEVNIFELPKAKKERFDNFLVANAFSQKDKLNTWIYFRQAMDLGVGMEEVVGVLFWKIKDMLIKKDFRNFTESKLKDSAARLSYLLPEARSSGLDAEAVFEKFLLEVF